MQILGLTLLPIAMLLELSRAMGPSFGVRHMLIMLLFGAALFAVGRLIEGYGART
jgi:hypothetical protein